MSKNIIILGAGESGVGAAILAKKLGYKVFVSDSGKIKERYVNLMIEKGIEYEQETHSMHKILQADEIIKSPGIPEKAQVMINIRNKKIPVVSEIEFAGRFTNAKKICITGSNGKTTTTNLVYELLRNGGLNVAIAGNVGKSFAQQVAECAYDYYVIELSSFQLDDMFEFKADVAILLNITPDHLDRYKYEFQNYIDSKFKITQNQTESDYFIFCADDEVIKKELTRKQIKSKFLPFSLNMKFEEGGFIEKNSMAIRFEKNDLSMFLEELALQGKHNTYNSMAAALAAGVYNIKNESIRQTLMNFKGVEHRLERFLTIRNVHFINDSKATNVNSVWYALECMKTPTILIMGGQDKGNDYSELFELVKEKVKAIICLGLDNSKIHAAFKDMVETYDTRSMEDAVKTAFLLANDGDTVLLSPACASFDLFENFEDRGRKFKEIVRNL